ncbi:hypothetical protein GGI05_005981 [Coemansia sp. RSA 2603]|nr:hypothetical protein GGI05_005981 [Coemansia sp. RSA 2603]
MILGVGIDILSLARIHAVVSRGPKYTQRFARRVLSTPERLRFASITSAAAQADFLAARWCLKEATYKAAFPHQSLRWHDISVTTDGRKPHVHVHWLPELAHLAVHASLSHDAGLVASYVVIENTK